LGYAASYRPGARATRRALDEGLNYFFCYGFDSQGIEVLRELNADRRERVVIATGAYNLVFCRQNLRKTLEKRLRQLKTDYIDVFQFLGVMKPEQMPDEVFDELRQLKASGRVRAVAMSCHHRKFAGEVAAAGRLDALMIRYNAAHRGAEQDVFPHLAAHGTGLVSYTATRWGYLLRPVKGRPKDGPKPTAGQCYRFVLSNPNVDVCLTAPRSEKELIENIAAVRQGQLAEDEMAFVREYGDAVRRAAGYFM
jgi:aryl-alcohol dehydrogenase-like predicted oxidoreductase